MTMDNDDVEKQQVHIGTVPVPQLEIWDEEAEERGLNRTEYIRQMVQAGRRNLRIDDRVDESAVTTPITTAVLKQEILERLEDEPMGDDELLEAIIDDIRDEFDAAFDDLADDQIEFSRSEGGWTK